VQSSGKPRSPEGPERADDAAGSAEPSNWNGEERRADDRRLQPTSPWNGLFGPVRRAGGRRSSDHRRAYVDRYTRSDVALLMAIFLLNVADAFFTMLWLDRGGREANPVMDFFLDIGPMAFLIQKCLVVGFWLVLLLVHKNFRLARLGLYASLAVYLLLMLLHFSLIALDVEPPAQREVASSQPIVRTGHPPAPFPSFDSPPQTRILASGGATTGPASSEAWTATDKAARSASE